MSVYTGELVAALTDAGYPAPHTPDTDPNVLAWSSDGTVPHLHVDDTGRVIVHDGERLDAEFTLGPQRQSAADWVALLHPHLAESVASAIGRTPVPEPESVVHRTAELVWLEPDTSGTYAVYTDNARIRVSDKNPVDAATALFDTERGTQLRITPDNLTTVLSVSTQNPAVMVNANLAVSTSIDNNGSWRPAITFRDTRGFLDRATDNQQGGVPPRQFRGLVAPVITLVGAFKHERDAMAFAEAVVRAIRRDQSAAAGRDLIER